MLFNTRWAPTCYKWSYNPDKWPYQWEYWVITLLKEVITPLVTRRGPPCSICTRWAGPYSRYKWSVISPLRAENQWVSMGFFFTLLIGAPCPSTTGDFGPTEHNNVFVNISSMKTYSEPECHRQTRISGHVQSDSQQKNKSPKAYTPKTLRWIPSMMVWKRWLLLNKDIFWYLC